ncbi:MAG: transcription elongation factor GreA [Spirochaetota bacterium]|nr:transcription elongation factor GreA [Spirochaetota bacterium]
MSEVAAMEQAISESPLLKDVYEQLTEEKWTRATIENYSKRNFVELDDIIEQAEKDAVSETLREVCVEHLNHSPKSIIGLYIAGILTYEQEILDDSFIYQVVTLFKENRKWQVVEYLCEKMLSYGESKFALTSLEEVYENTDNTEELLDIWERLSKIDYENGEIPRKLASHYEKEGNTTESVFYNKIALKRYAKKSNLRIVEDLWLKLVESIPDELDFFYQIKDEIAKQDPDKASGLLILTLPYYQERNDFDKVLEILKKVLSAQSKDKEIRDMVIGAFREKYKNHSLLEEYIEKSGLLNLNQEVKQAMDSFEKYVVFDRGNYVHHRSWEIGKIVDCTEDSLVIDFETKKNHTMSLKLALTSLKNLPEHHVWIQKRKNPDLLKKDDPEGIKNALMLIFKSHNNQATMKEIKKEMTEVIPVSSWTRWWNKAKQVMKTSSIFGNSLTKRDLYFLRDKPLTFEEEAFSNFGANVQFDGKLSVIMDYLKHSSDFDYEGFQIMLNYFVEIANNKSTIDDKTIKSFLLLRKIKRENAKVVFELKINPFELLTAKDDLIQAYSSLTDNEFRKDILDIIKKNDPDWEATFLTILTDCRATKTHNFIVDELVVHKKNEELKDGFLSIIDKYRNNPENYFWCAKTLIANPDLLEEVGLERKRLVFNLFHCLDIINKEINNKKPTSQKLNRKLLPQIVDYLIKEEAFINTVDDLNESDARKILALVNGLLSLDEKNRAQFTIKLFDKFPSLMKDEVETTKELHNFLVTKESYERKQKELQHILNVEIPNNSKAIGVAMELGDLRENADYIAALEHQKHLQEMASKLTEELNRIKILSVADVDDSSVNPGTKIEVKNLDSNEKENYIILGEWESDMEKGIISYKSPFGRSFLGAKTKDTIVFDHGGVKKKYKIEKIECAKEFINA